MATHSSTLAWKIPWAEEPGGLQSMASLLPSLPFSRFFFFCPQNMNLAFLSVE